MLRTVSTTDIGTQTDFDCICSKVQCRLPSDSAASCSNTSHNLQPCTLSQSTAPLSSSQHTESQHNTAFSSQLTASNSHLTDNTDPSYDPLHDSDLTTDMDSDQTADTDDTRLTLKMNASFLCLRLNLTDSSRPAHILSVVLLLLLSTNTLLAPCSLLLLSALPITLSPGTHHLKSAACQSAIFSSLLVFFCLVLPTPKSIVSLSSCACQSSVNLNSVAYNNTEISNNWLKNKI